MSCVYCAPKSRIRILQCKLISAEWPPQGANSAPPGGSEMMKPRAWGDHHSRRRAAPRRELRPLGGQRSGEATSVGGSSFDAVIRRLLHDLHVVHVRFAYPGRRDLDELGPRRQVADRG